MRYVIALILTLAGLTATAQQQSVQQTGIVTPGHVPQWTGNGVIQDAGPANLSSVTEFGVTKDGGDGICVSTNILLVNYQVLCMGAGSLTGGTLSLVGSGPEPFTLSNNGLIGVSIDGTTGVVSFPNGVGGGVGTVSSVSIATANGFAGTVTNPTTTPAITLSTSVTGVVKGNGTALAAATAGTDYVAPGGALGTPSSGVATNLTGTAAGLTAGHVTTNANLTGPITSSGNATTIANSIALPGSPTTTTQTALTDNTTVATTAYVDSAVAAVSPLLSVRVAVSSAQILALSGTPVQIIAPPGAGKLIVIISGTAELVYNSINYASGSGHGLYYDSNAGSPATNGPSDGLFRSNTSFNEVITPLANTPNSNTASANKGIYLTAASDVTTGNSTMVVTALYYVLTL